MNSECPPLEKCAFFIQTFCTRVRSTHAFAVLNKTLISLYLVQYNDAKLYFIKISPHKSKYIEILKYILVHESLVPYTAYYSICLYSIVNLNNRYRLRNIWIFTRKTACTDKQKSNTFQLLEIVKNISYKEWNSNMYLWEIIYL